MRWVLIRHGLTMGNLEGRYVGMRTDESLCPQGVARLLAEEAPPVRHVFASPMRRCLETARILYPGLPAEVVGDLRECDFGAFENRNHAELNGREDYQAWIDSGGEMRFPGGESRADLRQRTADCLDELADRYEGQRLLLVSHGGTIKAMFQHVVGPTLSDYRRSPRYGNTGVSSFRRVDGFWQLISWNDTSHLSRIGENESVTY
ncbi:MAG: histidine phosphatase family protein [Lentisphaeria bacterium]|nr:histidine phosphatase family protein [Lentisphaeria bacterium]